MGQDMVDGTLVSTLRLSGMPGKPREECQGVTLLWFVPEFDR